MDLSWPNLDKYPIGSIRPSKSSLWKPLSDTIPSSRVFYECLEGGRILVVTGEIRTREAPSSFVGGKGAKMTSMACSGIDRASIALAPFPNPFFRLHPSLRTTHVRMHTAQGLGRIHAYPCNVAIFRQPADYALNNVNRASTGRLRCVRDCNMALKMITFYHLCLEL